MKFRIKIKPNSKTDGIIREADGSLKVKIKAQPIDGKANKYLIEYFSVLLNLPQSKIILRKGETIAYKTIAIEAEENYVHDILSKF